MFFTRALLAPEDASIHGLYVLYNQPKELVAEAEDKLLERW